MTEASDEHLSIGPSLNWSTTSPHLTSPHLKIFFDADPSLQILFATRKKTQYTTSVKQQSLLQFEKRKPGRPRKVCRLTDGFGGSLLKGNPRQSRPIDIRKPLHLILKSTKAKGDLNFLNKRCSDRVRGTVFKYAKQFKIKVYRYVNVGNHLHLVILTPSDHAYRSFIRAVTGKIVIGLQTIFRKKLKGFWDHRPFSRVIVWGKDFAGIADYVLKNTLDVMGLKRTQQNLSWLRRRLKFEMLSVREKPCDSGQQLLFG